MEFFKLPDNAKEELLGCLKYYEIFDMSLLSARCTRVIKSTGRLILPIRIEISLNNNGFNCITTYLDKPVPEQRLLQLWLFRDFQDAIDVKHTKRNIGGRDIILRENELYCQSERYVEYRSQEEKEHFMSAVIEQLHSVFKNCEVARITYSLRGNNNTNFYRALRGVLKTQNLTFLPDGVRHMPDLPRMIVTHDYHNLCTNYIGGPTKADLKCRERINVEDLPIDQLLDLNCRLIHLRRSRYEAHNIIAFLTKWEKSTGEEMKNIEHVYIQCIRSFGNLNLTELNLQIDGERQYIERSDGKIGYIMQDAPNLFVFSVDSELANTDFGVPTNAVPPSPIVVPAIVAVPVIGHIREEFYTLESRDKQMFAISENALTLSAVLKKLLSMIRGSKEASSMPIPVSQINGNILALIVRWSEEHKNEPIPTRSEFLVISDFDMDLLNVSNKDLFNLIVAVDFLNIQPLLRITCKKAALLIKGKLLEEIRRIYCIPTDEEDEAAERAAAEERRQAARKGQGKGEAEPMNKRRHIA